MSLLLIVDQGEVQQNADYPNITDLFLFIYFISIFILLTRRKATEALIHKIGIYPRPVSGDAKILLSTCNLIEI